MNPLDITDEAGKQLFLERVRRNLAGEEVAPQAEFKIKTKDGKEMWASINATFTRKNGVINGAFVVAKDVTEHKKTEEALRRLNDELEERVQQRTAQVAAERQRLYQVLETLPVYVVLLDRDHRVPFANKVFRERFGESHGRRCYEYLFNRDSECSDCETYKVFKENKPHHWYWTGPDGRNYDIYDFPFNEADGSTLILEMGIDITAIRKGEEQLRASSAYTRTLIEASLDPLVTINAEGKITDVNKATESITGYSRDYLIGSDFSSYFTEPEKAEAGYKQVFTEGFVKDYLLAIKHKSGRITEVLYNAVVYRNEAGEIQGVFAAARDITERKQLERKLKDSERLAAIGATAGMVGHDIRNPLQSIVGDLYLIASDVASLPESEEKESIKESIASIKKSVEYLDKIVQDLQDFAKPLVPASKESDLEEICQEVLFKNGVPENVEASYDVEESAKRVVVDPDLLKRILSNLAHNAVQAMPNGGKLEIEAFLDWDVVVVTVEDTGLGIPDEVKPKLFTPLFTTKSKGQGFGLAVVKRMTEALGGSVTFESEVGKGAKFIVKLPQKGITANSGMESRHPAAFSDTS